MSSPIRADHSDDVLRAGCGQGVLINGKGNPKLKILSKEAF